MTPRGRRTLRRSIGDAKAHFAECVREAEAGRTVVITRHGRPVARLEPFSEGASEVKPRLPGDVAELGDVAEPAPPPYAAPSLAFQTVAARRAALHRRLVDQVWPLIPDELLGIGVTKREREEILGHAIDRETPKGTPHG